MKRYANSYSIAYVMLLSLLFGRGAPATAQRPESEKDAPAPVSWNFSYDSAGRPVKTIDPAGRKTVTSYEFDAQKRVQTATRRFADGSQVVRRYNRFGRCTEMQDAAGVVHYGYDGFNRMTSVLRDGMPSIAYAYDTRGRVTSIAVGEHKVEYVYDFLGRMAKIKTAAGEIAYRYQTGAGEVRRTLPNGIFTIWKYRPDGALESIEHGRPEPGSDRYFPIGKFEYFYRADGLISQVKETIDSKTKTIDYEYDSMRRLKGVKDSLLGTAEYGYDKLGNRTMVRLPGAPGGVPSTLGGSAAVASKYDWAGRLVEHDGQPCSHDAAGNLVSLRAGGTVSEFAFDLRNRLKTASRGGEKVEYVYDGEGALIARIAGGAPGTPGSRTTFIPDPRGQIWQPLLASEEDGRQTFYVWDGTSVVAALEGGAAGGYPRVGASQAEFYLGDHANSVRWTVGDQGNVLDTPHYDAFGVVQQARAAGTLRPGFAGLFFDPTCSLYVTLARSYDPALGRFLQAEPGVPFALFPALDDYARYAYCRADPVNHVDRDGWAIKAYWSGTYGDLVYQGETDDKLTPDHIPSYAAVKDHVEEQIGRKLDSHEEGQLNNMLVCISMTEKNHVKISDTWGSRSNATEKDPNSPDYGKTLHERDSKNLDQAAERSIQTYRDKLPQSELPDFERAVKAWREDRQENQQYLDKFIADRKPPSDPTNVGGIYLAGAGKALKGLGQLRGMTMDANGRLVLLTGEQGDVRLPPMRLDDVVTVFRSVYLYGGPLVSIDPNPKDPHGPTFLTRHDEGTIDTYPGWILFETDRVMKAYSIGYDNVSRQRVTSQVPGFEETLPKPGAVRDTDAEANVEAAKKEKKDNWHRFWIVPAEVNRQVTRRSELTLFDVPVKVNTQTMIMRDGKLVPAPDAKPDKQSAGFAEWFTKHYEEIGAESKLPPPPETEFTEPVAIFPELRRMALLTAIAEALRDQGVPMPAWMQNYQVKPCPSVKTTPAITVQTKVPIDSQGKVNGKIEMELVNYGDPCPPGCSINQVYGGVNLWPTDDAVHTVAASPAVEKLAVDVKAAMATAPPLVPVKVSSGTEQLQAVAFPGNETKALGACQITETDLTVPVQNGAAIGLTRRFHSFFLPNREFGPAWTMDLPYLASQMQPTKRTSDMVESRGIYDLTSPLNSWSALFRDRADVPEVGGKNLLVPVHSNDFWAVAGGSEGRIGSPTTTVLLRDGRSWHFDKSGYLVAEDQSPLMTIYRRNPAHRIEDIEGWYGEAKKADIKLEYDKDRLVLARGSNGDEVHYAYAADRLSDVKGPAGDVSYGYDAGGLIVRVERGGKLSSAYVYAPGGRLLSEKHGDGTETAYQVKQEGQRIEIAVSTSGGTDENGTPAPQVEKAVFDPAMRPVQRVLANGTQMAWTYSTTGTVHTATTADGDTLAVIRSPNQRQAEWRLPEGAAYHVEYGPGGQVLAVSESGGRTVLSREFDEQGRLRTIKDASTVQTNEYGKDGVPTRVFIEPPDKEHGAKGQVVKTVDPSGRTTRIQDLTGLDVQIGYDNPTGGPTSIKSAQGEISLKRNARGLVEGMKTSWGLQQTSAFDAKGRPQSGEIKVGKEKASVEYKNGQPAVIRNFDGGQVQLQYSPEGLVRHVDMPNGLALDFAYEKGRVSRVKCGKAYRCELGYDSAGRVTKCTYQPAEEPAGPEKPDLLLGGIPR